MPESSLVRQTVLKAVGAGKLVVKLSDGRAYDAEGCVEGILGKRRRTSGSLASFRLDDETLLTPASQPSAREWLKLDKDEEPDMLGLGGGFVPPISPLPVAAGKVQATTWEKLIEFAETRPLLELELTVTTPASAAKLISLAQPMGADALTLSVSVSGSSKDGGSLNFSAAEVKPNNPVRPLVVAQTLFTAMAETPMDEAQLKLSFIGGRTGTCDQLRKMAEAAPEDLMVVGRLDKPAGVSK